MTPEAAEKLLEEFAAKLGEHFDAVQILASWNEEAICHCVKRGAGNWYARQGMAHDFINADIAQENAMRIAEQMKERDEE